MRDTPVVMCWAPECAEIVVQGGRGRVQRYHTKACRQKALRRNGMKAPTEPYPPLLPTPEPSPTVVAPPEIPVSRPPSSPAAGPTAGHGAAVAHAETTAAAPAPSVVPVFTERPPLPPSVPAEPTISVAEHLAKLAEVANPPAPAPPPEHPLVVKYREDLEKLGQQSTREGLQVLQLAEKLVSSATSPAASAGLSRELKALMDGLEQNTPAAMAERDPSLIIRERTLAKLRLVGAA